VRYRGVSAALSRQEVQAWHGLLRVHTSLVRDVDSELRAAHGLPLSSYRVLQEMAAAPGGRLRMGELAERTMLTRPGLSGLVDRLERRALVERHRCEGDARGLYAEITAEGRRLLEQARTTHLESIRDQFTGRLTAAQLEQLGDVWRRLLRD
jgi:DNA-binding MarR family transcriptional regulator